MATKKKAKAKAPDQSKNQDELQKALDVALNKVKVLTKENIELKEKISDLSSSENLSKRKTEISDKDIDKDGNVKIRVVSPFIMGQQKLQPGDEIKVSKEKALSLIDDSADGGILAELI